VNANIRLKKLGIIMKVKELIKKLETFHENDEVFLEQEYNSNGGYVGISDVVEVDEEPAIVIEIALW
jgi:hypothetical protein